MPQAKRQLDYPAVYDVSYVLEGQKRTSEIKLMVPIPSWMDERLFLAGLLEDKLRKRVTDFHYAWNRHID